MYLMLLYTVGQYQTNYNQNYGQYRSMKVTLQLIVSMGTCITKFACFRDAFLGLVMRMYCTLIIVLSLCKVILVALTYWPGKDLLGKLVMVGIYKHD